MPMRPLSKFKQLLEPCLWMLTLSAVIYGLNRWDNKITDGFSHQALLGPFPPYEAGNLTSLTAAERAQIDSLFSKPFRYFAKGAQCFALESQDGTYVLKCFKQKHLYKTPTLRFLEKIPFLESYVQERLKRRSKRWECMTIGCHVAYERLREETGILYLHLAPTEDLPPVKIIDYRGIVKELDPNTFPFYLQKKGSSLKEGFLRFRENGDVLGAKKALHSLFVYLSHRTQAGVLDADPGYTQNMGWIDGKGTNLDIGKLIPCTWIKEPSRLHQDLTLHLATLREFFQTEYPEMVPAYDEELVALEQDSTKAQ